MKHLFSKHGVVSVPALACFALLALLPAVPALSGEGNFLLGVLTRMMVFGIAAVGLNLVLGFGGMVSMGHAMYVGIGAYAVALLSYHGMTALWLHVLVGLAAGIPLAIAVGYVCVRTSGMAFIMITLAIAQMMYFAAVSLKKYGGDDGLPVAQRSTLGWLDLDQPLVLYYLVLVVLAMSCFAVFRLVRSSFGMVLQGSKQNDRRALSLGLPTARYKVVAYALSAQFCVVAGVLLANLTRFAAPSFMSWIASGDLILMCVLGGLSSVVGPLVGAIAFVGIEELLTNFPAVLPGAATEAIRTYWLGLFGVFIVAAVMLLKKGLYGALVMEVGHGRRS
ncbi:MAG TPA: branched-chain amino acid ABC transporter permease [Ramlibacter sp.]|nr:branched-chain amino acid ABC transporter permease [Ramlibacter sp.]